MSADLITLPSFEPGSSEWAEQRRRAIGGSEIAPILGIGKWESRFSLWHRKQGVLDPQPDNPGMEWGRRLEPVIAQKYAEAHTDVVVLNAGTYMCESRPWQLASPDRLIGSPDAGRQGMLEVKTSYDADGWGEPGTDQIPVYYRAQCIWYLDVLGLPWCDVAVLIGASDYREYRVRYAADEAEYMRAEAEAFIASLDSGERPSIDQHSATYQAVRELHPEIEPVDVEIDSALVRAFCLSRQSLKAATDEAQRQTALLADALGNGRRATFLGDTIATRQARGDGTPYLVAARNLPSFDPKAA